MECPFDILREALEQLSWDADTQRRAFTDAAVTDELALDLDNAVRSLPHRAERLGITLDPELIADLTALLALFDAPPAPPSGTPPRSAPTPHGRRPDAPQRA